jgi:TRAP-type C4-dicarboxylate transport system substrate-binding protein
MISFSTDPGRGGRRRQFLRLLALVLPVVLGGLVSVGPAQADDAITLKIATLAPEGSTWYKALRRTADRWQEISGGKVQTRIYAGGVSGNEGAMLRKMRIGQLHGGAITNLGLMEIDKAPQVLQTPMLIRNYGELDYVMSKMTPEFERRITERGFVVVTWGDAGWAHLFTKRPMTSPDQAGQFKIYAWEGDPAAVEIFEKAGFKPVVVASTDVLPSLQSGLIDAFPQTPLAALALQWFAMAKNMLDLPWAPLVGATVLTDDAWNRIPAEFHEPFMKAAREVGAEVQEEIRRQDKKAVEVMKKYGLTVVPIDPGTQDAWDALVQSTYQIFSTKVVPADVFNQVKGLVEEYRAKHP